MISVCSVLINIVFMMISFRRRVWETFVDQWRDRYSSEKIWYDQNFLLGVISVLVWQSFVSGVYKETYELKRNCGHPSHGVKYGESRFNLEDEMSDNILDESSHKVGRLSSESSV